MGLSLATNIVIFSVIFSCLDVLAVFGRIFSRLKKPVPLGIDDALIVPGMLAAVALGILNICAVYLGGMGHHTSFSAQHRSLDPESFEIYSELQYASELTSVFSLTFVRLSILFFYRRIFRGKYFEVASWTLITLSTIWGISFFFATLFECFPVSEAWTTTPGQPGRNCYPLEQLVKFFNATIISSFLLDFSVLVLPQPVVWRLQMARKQRIGISLIFLLGTFVTGISIARIVLSEGAGSASFKDPQYLTAPTIYWAQLESQIAVICACLPTMRPTFGMIQNALQTMFQSLRSRSSKNSSRHRRIESGDRTNGAPSHGPSSRTNLNESNAQIAGAYDDTAIPLKDLSKHRNGQIGVHKTITTEAEPMP